MTREEAIAFFKDMNECTYGNLEAVEMAIKALEQKSVLDKIKENIQFIKDKCLPNNIAEEYEQKGLQEALDIIDKYREVKK